MKERDDVYIGALLHDIGKFVERTKCYRLSPEFQLNLDEAHPKYSAQFFQNMREKNPYYKGFTTEAGDLALYHHHPKNNLQSIVQVADHLSSQEREKNENKRGKYYETPLNSIFQNLFSQGSSETTYSYKLEKLNFGAVFPVNQNKVGPSTYQKLVRDFESEVAGIKNKLQLYNLLEKYLWAVPANTYGTTPDISLFDHLKTTAALALCLYDQQQAGQLEGNTNKTLETDRKKQFLLINGDISGIQPFIFNISSKGAAKSLKGRSVYIELLMNTIAKKLLNDLDLEPANLLYCGGGNFFILAPKCKAELFKQKRLEILETLLKAHRGELYLALDYTEVSPAEFENYQENVRNVKEKTGKLKSSKWSLLGLKQNYGQVFGPFDNGSTEKEVCRICGIAKSKTMDMSINESGDIICDFCNGFIKLTENLKKAKYIKFEKVETPPEVATTYNDVLAQMGYRITLTETPQPSDNAEDYKINDTDFIEEGMDGFIFGAYNLPFDKDSRNKSQLTFDQLAQKSIGKDGLGDKKLGYLKLDVDNLGSVFGKGLEKNKSISRITTLSRMLKIFFEGYINELIKEQKWEDNLYIVFSGGDDTFIIGSWNKVLDFAEAFRNSFESFCAENKYLTFSAGIQIYPPKYPVIRAADQVESALERAKHNQIKRAGAPVPEKNSFSILGEIFKREDLVKIWKIKQQLRQVVTDTGNRSLLKKVQKSTLGFKKILEGTNENMLDLVKFWRLAYYLRDVQREHSNEILKNYREIVINNLISKDKTNIKQIMIIPVAVRLAELETRKFVERE